jgi:hypothetical protein
MYDCESNTNGGHMSPVLKNEINNVIAEIWGNYTYKWNK